MRQALYRNRSPLMRREARRGSSQISELLHEPKKKYVHTGIYVEIYCLKGACSFPRLFGVVIS